MNWDMELPLLRVYNRLRTLKGNSFRESSTTVDINLIMMSDISVTGRHLEAVRVPLKHRR